MTEPADESPNPTGFSKSDYRSIFVAILLVLVFSMRKGTPEEVVVLLLKQLWAYFIYSIATVLIVIGLTKKMFKYKPTKPQIVKWAFYFAAFCAISQFLHELYLFFTGHIVAN